MTQATGQSYRDPAVVTVPASLASAEQACWENRMAPRSPQYLFRVPGKSRWWLSRHYGFQKHLHHAILKPALLWTNANVTVDIGGKSGRQFLHEECATLVQSRQVMKCIPRKLVICWSYKLAGAFCQPAVQCLSTYMVLEAGRWEYQGKQSETR